VRLSFPRASLHSFIFSMANSFNKTSFIPQKSISREGGKKKPTAGLFFGAAVLFFAISILASVGVFFYKKILEGRVESKAVSLERAKEAFDPGLIEELSRLNSRIEASDDIISSHLLLTPLFKLIEESTLKNVRFSQFDFLVRDSGNIELFMTGQALDYATVVLQSDLFGQSKFLKNQVFSNINLDSFGNVGFLFKAEVDPGLVLFKSNVEGF